MAAGAPWLSDGGKCVIGCLDCRGDAAEDLRLSVETTEEEWAGDCDLLCFLCFLDVECFLWLESVGRGAPDCSWGVWHVEPSFERLITKVRGLATPSSCVMGTLPEAPVMHSCEDTFFKRTAELSAVQPVSCVGGVATVTFLTSSAVVFRARTAAEEGEPRMYFPIGIMEGVLFLGTTLVCNKWSAEEESKGLTICKGCWEGTEAGVSRTSSSPEE